MNEPVATSDIAEPPENIIPAGKTETRSAIIVYIIFLLAVPVTAHLLYSWMGFNPTDEGFVLAGSRRIVDGQVPHRDFISVRPAGSYFLHVPVFLVGGSRVFWISRYFSWLQFAAIALCWVIILSRLSGGRLSYLRQMMYALVAFAFSAHHWAPMAWHSTDALFLVSAGLFLATGAGRWMKFSGYFLIGFSVLCRQNFLLVLPASILLLGDWKKLRYWGMLLAPSLIMFFFLLLTGAVKDAWLQLSSHTGLWDVGVANYLKRKWLLWGVLLGALAAWLTSNPGKKFFGRKLAWATCLAGAVIYYGVLVRAVVYLVRGEYVINPCFMLFGAVLGSFACRLAGTRRLDGFARFMLLSLLAAWSISISVGYPSVAMGTAGLAVLLLAQAEKVFHLPGEPPIAAKFASAVTLVLTLAVLVSFDYVRRSYVYRDVAASDLNRRVGEVLPGTRHIWTGRFTYAFLLDLQNAVKKTGEGRFAVVPDLAAYWVKSEQSNPLPADWPVQTELKDERLLKRVLDKIESIRGDTAIIVQKVKAEALLIGVPVPIPEDDFYSVVEYVRSNFEKTGETVFFEIYGPPARKAPVSTEGNSDSSAAEPESP